MVKHRYMTKKLRPVNILLIEDNPDDQELIQEYLCDVEYIELGVHPIKKVV